MYAILRAGGKQLKVAPGDIVRIEKPARRVEPGEELTLADVLFAGGEEGKAPPDPGGVSVRATVVKQIRGPKVLVFKKKRTKQYRRTKGHRQALLEIRIEAIETT